MRIYGLTKTTLLDYPQRTACTVFTGNCNLRCCYCHNASLVQGYEEKQLIPEEEFFAFLDKRKNILQGVCITGGEPTIQEDLKPFIKKIKEKGFCVKLDTNGLRPDVLKELVYEKLIDMAALDIKTDKERYPALTQVPGIDMSKIEESAAFLIEGNVDYELRTTVVKEYFDEEVAENIGKWLKGAKVLYLQAFVDSESVMKRGLHSCTKEEMIRYSEILSDYIERVELRGIE